jgi:hypothetical protein
MSVFLFLVAARVDSMAGDGVCKLKEKYPVLHTSPSEVTNPNLYSLFSPLIARIEND